MKIIALGYNDINDINDEEVFASIEYTLENWKRNTITDYGNFAICTGTQKIPGMQEVAVEFRNKKTVIPALQGFLDKKKEWKNINSSTPFFLFTRACLFIYWSSELNVKFIQYVTCCHVDSDCGAVL